MCEKVVVAGLRGERRQLHVVLSGGSEDHGGGAHDGLLLDLLSERLQDVVALRVGFDVIERVDRD